MINRRRPLAYEPRYALNAICPYFTMFPLEYPLRVLKKHKSVSPVVMDPFCGRGTTMFAARLLGLVSRGVDASPVAVAIARAKLCRSSTEEVLALAKYFIETVSPEHIPDSPFFEGCFNADVLRELCSIRKGLLDLQRDTDESVLLRATVLGCLHGPLSKCPDKRAYLSNQMPRTFASKPDYSIKYWSSHNLMPPKVDILEVLSRKLARLNTESIGGTSSFRNVRLGDARFAKSFPDSSRDFSVVVTSPPYYGMRTYIQDQWLRNWFLGGPEHIEYSNPDQLVHTGKDVFSESLGAVWRNMSRTCANDLHMYVRFGSIPSSKSDPKTLMFNSLEASGVSWKLKSTRPAATAASGKRQAAHMTAKSTAAVEFDFHVYRV